MPFEVTQWGYSPDPRPPDYALLGYDFGQLPPWRWLMKTTDADFPYMALNDGVLWESSSFLPNFGAWLPLVPIPDVLEPLLFNNGTQEIVALPTPNTITFNCSFFNFFSPFRSSGVIRLVYPDALRVWSFTMSGSGTGGPFFPNPLTITPHKWNAAL